MPLCLHWLQTALKLLFRKCPNFNLLEITNCNLNGKDLSWGILMEISHLLEFWCKIQYYNFLLYILWFNFGFQESLHEKCTAWKVSKYGVVSGPYFPAFGLNTERYSVFSPYLSVFSPNEGKYGPEITP